MNKSSLPREREFWSWAQGPWQKAIGVAVALVYAFVGAYVKDPDAKAGAEQTFSSLSGFLSSPVSPSLIQVAALLPLAIVCFRTKCRDGLIERPINEDALTASEQFRKSLTVLILTWAAFYALVAVREYWRIERLDPLIDFANVLQGVFLFACYYILTAKTVPKNGSPPKPFSLPLLYSYLFWGSFVFLVADMWLSPLGEPYRLGLQLFSGLVVGACLALFVGALESQYLGQPRFVAMLLYVYAVLQVAYIGFFNDIQNSPLQPLQNVATVLSLPLKLVFIGFWTWVFGNGMLVFYMRNERQTIETVDAKWNSFLENV